MGHLRSAVLYLSGALSGGLVFATLSPERVALAGGFFVVGAAIAALAMYTVVTRRLTMRRQWLFISLAVIWIVVAMSPSNAVYHLLMHVSSWTAGALVALWSMKTSSPNSALQATPDPGALERER